MKSEGRNNDQLMECLRCHIRIPLSETDAHTKWHNEEDRGQGCAAGGASCDGSEPRQFGDNSSVGASVTGVNMYPNPQGQWVRGPPGLRGHAPLGHAPLGHTPHGHAPRGHAPRGPGPGPGRPPQGHPPPWQSMPMNVAPMIRPPPPPYMGSGIDGRGGGSLPDAVDMIPCEICSGNVPFSEYSAHMLHAHRVNIPGTSNPPPQIPQMPPLIVSGGPNGPRMMFRGPPNEMLALILAFMGAHGAENDEDDDKEQEEYAGRMGVENLVTAPSQLPKFPFMKDKGQQQKYIYIYIYIDV